MANSLSLLPGGVLVVDERSRLVSVNEYAQSLLGHTADELIGQRIDALLNVASRIYYQTHIYPLLTLGTVANELNLSLLTKQRVTVPVLMNAACVEEDGQIRRYLLFIPVYQRHQYEQALLTARKTAEAALLRNDELVQLKETLEQHQRILDEQMNALRQRKDELEQFSKIIAHDLQEPLRKINLFASVLEQEQADALSSTGRLSLTGMATASQRLRELIADLQRYFTLSASSDIRKRVNTSDAVQQAAEEYADNELQLACGPLPTLIGDPNELAALFRHLLSNAVKFRQPGGPATVRIEGVVLSRNSFRHVPDKYHYTDYVRITVRDEGIGFESHRGEEVFRILKKLHPNMPGLGLGLAFAKKIVEHHNGEIKADSAVGQGTRLTIWLPAYVESGARPNGA